METRSTTLGDDLDDRMTSDVEYPGENISDWIRDAVRIRLYLDNDRELLDQLDANGEEADS